MSALKDLSCDSHIGDTTVGTRSDNNLVDLNIAFFMYLIDCMSILREVREGNGRTKLIQIDLINFIILGILISFEYLVISIGMLLEIFDSLIINRENTVLSACFNCHVGYGESVIH